MHQDPGSAQRILIFYINTPLDKFEYMHFPIDVTPEDIIKIYKLREIVNEGWVNIDTRKVIYGLP